jgi:hypothetical protein
MNQEFRGKRITRIFVALGRITEAQALEAEQRTLTSGVALLQYLRESGWVSPQELLEALSLQSGFPILDREELTVDPEMLTLFKPRVLVTYQFLPYEHHDHVVCVAVDTPLSPAIIRTLEQRFGVKLLVSLASQHLVQAQLCLLTPQDNRRRSPRHTVALPLVLNPADDVSQNIHGLTINLSSGGLMFHTRTNLCAFNPGMRFTVSEPRKLLSGFGVLRQFSRDNERVGERWIGRIEFLNVDQPAAEPAPSVEAPVPHLLEAT